MFAARPPRESPLSLASSRSCRASGICRRAGFTLVELLLAVGILGMILTILGSFVSGLTHTVQQGNVHLQRIGQAQRAVDILRRTLSAATLNPYYDYADKTGALRTGLEIQNSTWVPASYIRVSDLRFIVGPAAALTVKSPYDGAKVLGHAAFFQVDAGFTNIALVGPLKGLLNTVGFYLEYGKRSDFSPVVPGSTSEGKQFRLMMMIEPSESLSIYSLTSNRNYAGKAWYTTPLATKGNVHLLAENVLAFVLRPKQAVAGSATSWSYFAYPYDSSLGSGTATQLATQHELPPLIEVTLVLLDSRAALQLEQISGGNSPDFLGLSSLFSNPGDVSYTSSLNALSNSLNEKKIAYHIETMDVPMTGANW